MTTTVLRLKSCEIYSQRVRVMLKKDDNTGGVERTRTCGNTARYRWLHMAYYKQQIL